MSIRRLFRLDRRRADVPREVDDELAFHIDMRVEALARQGWQLDEARREAARQFGNLDQVRGSCISLDNQRERAMHRISFFEEFGQDVRYALRVLRRSPGFAVAVVLVLSLGIGANTAIFSLVDAVLRRPLPVEHPERLLAIGNPTRVSSLSQGDVRSDLISYPMFKSFQSDSVIGKSLLASGRPPRLDIRMDASQADVEHARGRLVSANYFRVLGVPAMTGRVFNGTEDDAWGSSPTVVISDAYWARRFNRDPKVIGKNITINNATFTIVGVTPTTFFGEIVGASIDMWLPISMQGVLSPNQLLATDKLSSWLLLLLRVPDAYTMPQADQLMRAKVTRWVKEQQLNATAEVPELFVASGEKGFSRVRQNMAAPLGVMMMGVGLLLLLVCANVANLLLARAVSRGREISVRLAIGARRSRLIRQLIAESMVLAALGAVGGLAMSWYATKLLLRLSNEGGGTPLVLKLDPPVLIFTAVVAVVSVVFFGLVPALHASRVNLSSAMRGNAIGVGGSRNGKRPGLSQLLVAGQVALSLALLVSAGLLARDLRYLQQIDTGLDRDHILALEVDAVSAGIDSVRLVLLAEAMRKELATISGAATVSYSENGIFGGQESTTTIKVPGYEARKEGDLDSDYDAVGPDYIKSIGARLVGGRDISAEDVSGRQTVALVNEAFVRKFMTGKNAVDATFSSDDNQPIRIVGVVADVRDHTLSTPPTPRFYLAYAQNVRPGPRALRVLIHTSGDPAKIITATRAAIRRVNPTLVVEDVVPVSVRMANSIGTQRLLMQMALIFGGLALTLAAIGLYGVMSYVVSRRTSEIGLRMALGARRSSVVRLVLFDALRLVLLGVLIGLPLAIALARLLGKQLHGVNAMDPVTIALSLTVLTLSAGAAALAPALRASRVAPLQAIGRG